MSNEWLKWLFMWYTQALNSPFMLIFRISGRSLRCDDDSHDAHDDDNDDDDDDDGGDSDDEDEDEDEDDSNTNLFMSHAHSNK